MDFETKSDYEVTITFSDGTLSDTITVTINVSNVDENVAPVFTEGTSATRSIAENTGSGVDIGTPVAATDADGTLSDTITVTINVSNVDENVAPVFTEGTSATRSIAENTGSGLILALPLQRQMLMKRMN